MFPYTPTMTVGLNMFSRAPSSYDRCQIKRFEKEGCADVKQGYSATALYTHGILRPSSLLPFPEGAQILGGHNRHRPGQPRTDGTNGTLALLSAAAQRVHRCQADSGMSKKESGKSVLDLERLGGGKSSSLFKILLARYLNQPVKVKFSGGREVKGILKGRAFSCPTV